MLTNGPQNNEGICRLTDSGVSFSDALSRRLARAFALSRIVEAAIALKCRQGGG